MTITSSGFCCLVAPLRQGRGRGESNGLGTVQKLRGGGGGISAGGEGGAGGEGREVAGQPSNPNRL